MLCPGDKGFPLGLWFLTPPLVYQGHLASLLGLSGFIKPIKRTPSQSWLHMEKIHENLVWGVHMMPCNYGVLSAFIDLNSFQASTVLLKNVQVCLQCFQ
jgi:hypothetical protein